MQAPGVFSDPSNNQARKEVQETKEGDQRRAAGRRQLPGASGFLALSVCDDYMPHSCNHRPPKCLLLGFIVTDPLLPELCLSWAAILSRVQLVRLGGARGPEFWQLSPGA